MSRWRPISAWASLFRDGDLPSSAKAIWFFIILFFPIFGSLVFYGVVMTVVLPLVPVCIAVSVLRYRLYEIDRILSRTVAYLLVTGIVVGVYIGAVAAIDQVLGFSSSVAVAASTLAAAALFRPLLRRVQRGVDRRFNRERYDSGRVVDGFAVRLRDEIDPTVVQGDLLSVTARAVQPSQVSLWVVHT